MNEQENSQNIQHNRRQYDILLEKIIQITEDSLRIQNEYLHKLETLKNRFDMNDRDHSDMKSQLSPVSIHTLEILNKFNKASTGDILDILTQIKECNTGFSYKFNNAEELIKKLYDKISSSFATILEDNKLIKKEVIDSSKSFTLIQKILAAILTTIIGFQIVFTLWKLNKEDTIANDMKNVVIEEFKKQKK